jgi:hypothetical protein
MVQAISDVRPVTAGRPLVRSLFLGWERLRFPYNLVLIIVMMVTAVAVGLGPRLAERRVVSYFVSNSIVANICFLLGACAEAYLNLYDLRPRWLRPTIFTALTLLAATLGYLLTMICARVVSGEFVDFRA